MDGRIHGYVSLDRQTDRAIDEHFVYGLVDRGCKVRVPARAGNFSLYHHVHTGSGFHPTSNPMSTGDSFSGGKAAVA
jgi:hypothetical protein